MEAHREIIEIDFSDLHIDQLALVAVAMSTCETPEQYDALQSVRDAIWKLAESRNEHEKLIRRLQWLGKATNPVLVKLRNLNG